MIRFKDGPVSIPFKIAAAKAGPLAVVGALGLLLFGCAMAQEPRQAVLVAVPDGLPRADSSLSSTIHRAAERAVSEQEGLHLLPREGEAWPTTTGADGSRVPVRPRYYFTPTAVPQGLDSILIAVRIADARTTEVIVAERQVVARWEVARTMLELARAAWRRALSGRPAA